MKTEMTMKRQLLGGVIRQKHKSGYLSLNDLMLIGNEFRRKNALPPKKIEQYFQVDSHKEFLKEVALVEGCTVDDLRIVIRGRNGSQYAHPLVFLDVAMWFNPKLKVHILKWFYDNLLLYRDNSGESFKSMMAALDAAGHMKKVAMYALVAKRIACACGVFSDGKDRWQTATEDQLKLRDRIQENVAVLADMDKDVNVVIQKAIEKAKQVPIEGR